MPVKTRSIYKLKNMLEKVCITFLIVIKTNVYFPKSRLNFYSSYQNQLKSVQVMVHLHIFPIFSFLAKMKTSENMQADLNLNGLQSPHEFIGKNQLSYLSLALKLRSHKWASQQCQSKET